MTVRHHRTWVDAPIRDVADRALQGDALADWLDPLASARGDDLRRVGAVTHVTFADRRRTSARLRTTRAVRDVVAMDVLVDDARVGEVWLSMSAWDGGTAVEVVTDLPGPLSRAGTRRPLVAAASTPGGRTGMVPSPDVAPTGTS